MIEITYIFLISIDDERYKYLYDKCPRNMNSLCIIKKKTYIHSSLNIEKLDRDYFLLLKFYLRRNK